MLALEIYGLLALASFLLIGWIVVRPILAAWLYKHFSDPDRYPPEAAEAPTVVGVQGLRTNEVPPRVGVGSLDEHFTTVPRDLDGDLDWHRYEYEMRKQT